MLLQQQSWNILQVGICSQQQQRSTKGIKGHDSAGSKQCRRSLSINMQGW
jgi:hypothetical protein